MLNLGFYVLRPMAAHGPIDICAYDNLGNYFFLDAKMDSRRRLPGRIKKNRIYRAFQGTYQRRSRRSIRMAFAVFGLSYFELMKGWLSGGNVTYFPFGSIGSTLPLTNHAGIF